MDAKRALAIRHVAFEDVGSFAPVLARHALALDYVEAPDGLAHVDADEPALLIVLGGPIGAYEEAAYPFLADELRLLERRLRARRPTFGVCLGSQLIARALGARVYPGGRKEIGWAPLEFTAKGAASPLAALAQGRCPVLHWHGDTFDLPAGAVRLASTPLYDNQAFSWGESVLALQFHAEVTGVGLERWFVGHACEIAQTPHLSVEVLRAETQRHAPALGRIGQACFSAWLREIGL